MRLKTILAAVTMTTGATMALTPAHASIPKSSSREAVAPRAISLQRTQEALRLPMGERIGRLRGQGAAGYRNLVQIMFDESAEMDARWKAVTAVGRLGGTEARPEIERALKHDVWYMRNAGLIAAKTIDREIAVKAARQLISDKALVVRASAVETLSELNDRESTDLLWKKLEAPENFKGGQSLYIRIKIAEALARLEKPGREAKFIGLLSDRDTDLHAPALHALERLTKASVAPANGNMDSRRAAWLKWWKNKKG